MRSIKYVSYGDTTGYGLSGLAYIRGLLNQGCRVQWLPIFWGAQGLQYWHPSLGREVLEVVNASKGDPSLRDIHAILDATTQADDTDHETVIHHLIPEYMPDTEPGKRNLAYCAWESDRIPAHWPVLLNRYDAVFVPSRFNAEVFVAGGVTVPVHVVPHIRRHAHEETTPAQRAQLRSQLDIPSHHFVFYSIGAWMLRKDFPRLVQAFIEEFERQEPVSLLIKTSTYAVHHALPHEDGKHTLQMVQEAVDETHARCGRLGGHVAVIAADGISGAWIDCIHQLGDAYVSLSRAEGWGMGGFEAALLGRPVLMTGWGGVLDYLGEDHPLNLGYRLEHIDWPGTSYAPDHRWAVTDVADVRRKLRAVFESSRSASDWAFERAAELSEHIGERYAEARVMRDWLKCF